jgi:hypothetical protein
MRMKFSVHTGAKFDDKAPDLARWPFQRPSVLKQIEKLARTTDYQLQEDYQWLCNAVHPSVGGMLSFTAPLLAHEKKTHAFHVVCEDPTRLRLGEKVPELKRTRLPKCEGAPLGAEWRTTTIQDAIARAATFSVDVLERTLDDALSVIDDVGLTTKAPIMASFGYWRNLTRSQGSAICPCRSGRKAKHCLHRWTDPAPTVAERFDIGSR